MASKRDPAERELSALNRATLLPSDEAAELVLEGLASRHAAVVAQAALIAGELELREVVPGLIDAYLRLATDPEKLDPVCAVACARLVCDVGSPLYDSATAPAALRARVDRIRAGFTRRPDDARSRRGVRR